MADPGKKRALLLPILLLVIGGVLIGGYYAAKGLGVGKIGQPTDIGGGAILIVGVLLAAAGVVAGIVTLIWPPLDQ